MANDAALEEDVELDLERRRYVLDVFARLDSLTYYELLEVPRDASEKMVKRAYFQIVRVTHPDRYFGKNLGSYKTKLEAIFARQTKAYETLADAAARADYDATLGPAAPAAPPPRAPTTSPPAGAPPAAATPPPSAPPPTAPIDPAVAARKAAALEGLKAMMGANKARADQHVVAAKRALAAGDLVSALSAYREALRLAPSDATIKAAAAELERQVAQRTGEAARRQAELEERHGHFAQAAASWQRVLAVFPGDPEATARLAAALARAKRGG